MLMPKRETQQAIEERGTVKEEYARFFGPILFGMVMIVALCAFIPSLAGLLNGEYGGIWGAAMGLFVFASITLPAMFPTLPKRKGDWTVRQLRWPEWSLMSYFFIIGLGLNWACAFLWFSRRYAFFSTPVIAATSVTVAFYAAIAFLVAQLTGRNWRAALLVFVFAPGVLACVVLRLGLLR
jgi:hypothetical protein